MPGSSKARVPSDEGQSAVAEASDALVTFTHYDCLNLPSDATSEMIQAQYLALLATATPEEAQALLQAYTVLSDPAQRASYDEQIAPFRAQQNRRSSSAPIKESLTKKHGFFETFLQALVEDPEQERPYEGVVRAIVNTRRQEGKMPCPLDRLRFVDFTKYTAALSNYPSFLFHVLPYAALLAHLVEDPEQACVDTEVTNALRNVRWVQCRDRLRELEQSPEADDNAALLNRLGCFFEDSDTVSTRLDDKAFRTSLSAADLALLALARPILATAISNHQNCVDKLFSAFRNNPFVKQAVVYVIYRDPSLVTQYVSSQPTTPLLNAVMETYGTQGLKTAGVEYLLCTLERLPLYQKDYILDLRRRAYVTLRRNGSGRGRAFVVNYDETKKMLTRWIPEVYTGEALALAYCRLALLQYAHTLSTALGKGGIPLPEGMMSCIELLTQPIPNAEGLEIPAVWYLDRFQVLKEKLAKAFLPLEWVFYNEKIAARWLPSGKEQVCQLFVMYHAVEARNSPIKAKANYYIDRLRQYKKHPKQVEKALIERLCWTRDLQLIREACNSKTFLGKVMQSCMKSFAKKVPIEDALVHELCQTNNLDVLQEACNPQTDLGKIIHSRTKRSGENTVIENVLLRYLCQADKAQVEAVRRELSRKGSHLEGLMAPRKQFFEKRLQAEGFVARNTRHSMDTTKAAVVAMQRFAVVTTGTSTPATSTSPDNSGTGRSTTTTAKGSSLNLEFKGP